MSQSIPGQHQAQPLPGLVKFYFIQLYPLVFSLLAIRLVFALVGVKVESTELMLWSLVAMVAGFAGIALLVGLHSRAAWAPSFAGSYNLALLTLCLLLAARIAVSMAKMSFGRWGFDLSDLYLFLFPAFLLMQTPVLYAWHRYFTTSPKVAAAYGATPLDDESPLPGLGVAFLRVISAAYFLFFVTFMALTARHMSGVLTQTMWLGLAISAAPFIIMPAIIFYLSGSPNRPARPLLIAVGAFGVLTWLWMRVPHITATFTLDQYGELYALITAPATMPMPALLLLLCIAVLGWKIWADKDEQGWFSDGRTASREPNMFGIYALGLIVYNLVFVFNITQSLVLNPPYESLTDVWPEVIVMLLGLGVLALCLLLLYRLAKHGRDEKRLTLFTFGGTLLLALGGCGLILLEIAGSSYKASQLSTLIRVFASPLTLVVFAVLHWRARYRSGTEGGAERTGGFFGLPAPYLAFTLLCLLLISGNLPPRVFDLLGSLIYGDDNARWLRSAASPAHILLSLEYWAAYAVFPVLALKSFKKLARGEQTRFFLLGVFWLLAIVLSLTSETTRLLQEDLFRYAMGPSLLLNIDAQVYAYALVIFMLYLAARGKNAAPGSAS